MTFGKKGLVAGAVQPAARAPRRTNPFAQSAAEPATRNVGQEDPIAAKREAFIAAERERRLEAGEELASAPSQFDGPFDAGSRQSSLKRKPSFFDQFAPRKPSLALAYVIWFLLSNCSAHRFYLGAHESALKQIGLLFVSLFLGLLVHPAFALGIVVWIFWILADLFLMPGLHKERMKKSAYDTGVFA